VLLVDEVDDSRKTLAYAAQQLLNDFSQERDAYHERFTLDNAAHVSSSGINGAAGAWKEPVLGIFVVHNKVSALGAVRLLLDGFVCPVARHYCW